MASPRPARRIVDLAGLDERAGEPEPSTRVAISAPRGADGSSWRRLRTSDGWLRLAERMIGDWAATLRVALALAVGLVALVAVLFMVMLGIA